MNDREILDRLWEAHRETPFASFSLQRKLDIRHNAVRTVLNLINDMADSGEVRSGYRIKRVASTVYKMTQAQQGDSDSPKGLPLPNENEAVLGQPESDCLSTDGGNGENSVSEQTDPFPDAEKYEYRMPVAATSIGNPCFSYCSGQSGFRRKPVAALGISQRCHPPRYYPVCRHGEGVCARSVCQVP